MKAPHAGHAGHGQRRAARSLRRAHSERVPRHPRTRIWPRSSRNQPRHSPPRPTRNPTSPSRRHPRSRPLRRRWLTPCGGANQGLRPYAPVGRYPFLRVGWGRLPCTETADCGPSACRLWSIGLPTVVHRPADCGPSARRLWSIGLPSVVHRPADCGPSACRLWSIGLPTVVHRPADCGPSACRAWSIGLPSVVHRPAECGRGGSELRYKWLCSPSLEDDPACPNGQGGCRGRGGWGVRSADFSGPLFPKAARSPPAPVAQAAAPSPRNAAKTHGCLTPPGSASPTPLSDPRA